MTTPTSNFAQSFWSPHDPGMIKLLLKLLLSLIISTYGKAGHTCKVCGTFKMISDPKSAMLDHMRMMMEYTDEARKGLREASNTTIVINHSGDLYTIEKNVNTLGKVITIFENGKTFDLEFEDGRMMNSTVTVSEEERKIAFVHQFPDFVMNEEGVVDNFGLIITYTVGENKTKEMYQVVRIQEDKLKGDVVNQALSLGGPKTRKGGAPGTKSSKVNFALLNV